MKTTTLISKLAMIVSIFAAASAFANDDLKAIMKTMGKDFKSLGMQSSNASQNSSSVALAKDISKQLQSALNEVPDTVSNLAPADQPAALAEYQSDIKKVLGEMDQVISALQSNDNATAASVLNQVAQDKKNGHDKFNPQPQ